jgi:hypothetical protein
VIAVAAPSRHSLRYHARAGTSYRFYTVAVDHSGNRESKPVTATTRVVG